MATLPDRGLVAGALALSPPAAAGSPPRALPAATVLLIRRM